jgi:gliding motility-associated-like protein
LTKFLLILSLKSSAQSCISTQFSKAYTFEGSGDYANNCAILQNGHFLFGGLKNYQSTLTRTDNNGDTIWAAKYFNPNATMYNGYAVSDVDLNENCFISASVDCIALINTNGNVVTSKQLKLSGSNVDIRGVGILPNNDKIVLAKDESAYGTNRFLLLCLSPDISTIKWNKYVASPTLYLNNLTILENKIFLLGTDNNEGVILCLDSQNGSLVNRKKITIDNNYVNTDKIFSYSNGYILTVRNRVGFDIYYVIYRLDSNLDPINVYQFPTFNNAPWQDASLALFVEPEGDYFGCWSTQEFGHVRFFITKQDSVIWKRWSQDVSLTTPKKLIKTNKGLVLFSGGTNIFDVGTQTYISIFSLCRSDENGSFANCYNADQPLPKTNINYIISLSTLQAADTNTVILQPVNITRQPFSYNVTQFCNATSNCNNLNITGNNPYCNNDPTIYIAHKNPGCFLPVEWTISGGPASIQKLSDSTILVQYLQSGSYTLTASLDDSCSFIADTIHVNVSIHSALNLGPDTTLCLNNTKLLNAHSGYTSYLWQDGSTDSTYTVTTPGLYWVEVKDACNNIYRDSITITQAPPIPFNIGPDLSKCNNDSLTITAPSGFLNYSWSPNYNINTTSGQTVKVFPAIDTIYRVAAEKTPECFAYDTLKISVFHSTPINLGPDASFCQGDSIVLNAGNGFNSYLWSTGQITNQIIVKNIGMYSIVATDNNNCKSKDTLIVQNVFPNPAINLPKDSLLCLGAQATLSAGNGYSSYLWNTGNTSPSINVSSVGTYWVSVIDINGCKGNDTTNITRLLPVPNAFLPNDTILCTYMSMQLKPSNSYKNYLWSNGSITSSITISQPGTYWLQVHDNYDCIGKDSIIINPKQCLEGFYIPKAFTPNKDGKNDIFRPLIFGNVISLRFTIYDRWGQRIFETSELQKGWDGKVNGIDTNSDVFVWFCTYQIQGQEIKKEKGTFVLIR